MLRNNKTSFKLITNQMTINVKMLGTFVEDGVGNDIHGSLIVTPKINGNRNVKVKITSNVGNPLNFTDSSTKRAVFNFSSGSGDCILLFGLSRNKSMAKKNAVTCNGLASIWTSAPIGIAISLENQKIVRMI